MDKLALGVDIYNLLGEDIWLPATGLDKYYALPVVNGRSIFIGFDIAF